MRPLGPVVDPLPCSGCGKELDPLRAGHVAIFDAKLHHFCNAGACRARFLAISGAAPEPPRLAPSAAPASVPPAASERAPDPAPRASYVEAIALAYEPDLAIRDLPEPPPLSEPRSLIEPVARTILASAPPTLDARDPRDMGTLLLVIAIASGALAVALLLAGDAVIVAAARIVLVFVGVAMLVGRAVTTAREVDAPHSASMIAPSFAAALIAIWALLSPDRALGSEAASLAGIIVTTAALGLWLIDEARRRTHGERAWVEQALTAPARRATDEAPGAGEDFEPRVGEHLVVQTGEVVPVDLTVVGDEVDVYPWLEATTAVRRRAGDSVVAGARVARGTLTGACTWTGHDRAFARMLLDPRRRADALAPIATASRALAERWSMVAAVIAAVSALIAARRPIEIAMVGVGVYAALSGAVTASIAAVHVGRSVLLALRRGITYKSSDAWDRAGQVNVAVFCARGTLLLGEPELTEIEPQTSKVSRLSLLALAAGAERTGEHPIAYAIARAARVQGVRPDGVRNATIYPGLGVVAVTAQGEPICVGSRALLLEQRISIAHAEPRISELESLGRVVVLVAVGSRLAGLFGLQDGLRPGARAAVQHLLDVNVEPVLMSGDARETCEAIARSLDIDHIRPEVLPDQRGSEVASLIEAGANVAVLGHPAVDEPSLQAASVSIALGAAGAPESDYAIALASDDVRDAALAIFLAHRSRTEARVGLALAAGPALFGSVAIGVGVLPPAFAPLAALIGAVMAVVHLRALDRLRSQGEAAPPSEG